MSDTVFPKRRRNIPIYFMVTPQENEQIQQKMMSAGFSNMGAYLRKQAIDGYVLQVELEGIQEAIRLLRINTNNLNQIAKRANETRSIYKEDIKELQDRYSQLWETMRTIVQELSEI